jgi:hypothetical protein
VSAKSGEVQIAESMMMAASPVGAGFLMTKLDLLGCWLARLWMLRAQSETRWRRPRRSAVWLDFLWVGEDLDRGILHVDGCSPGRASCSDVCELTYNKNLAAANHRASAVSHGARPLACYRQSRPNRSWDNGRLNIRTIVRFLLVSCAYGEQFFHTWGS